MYTNRWEGLDEFVAVAECGQFTAAAQRLGVSSSHVSRQIVRLEERLQTRLLYRSTRKVALTEAGQTFLHHCQRLQDGREEALRAVGDLASEPKGLLRMTCAVAYGERFITPLVTRFMDVYPHLRVDIELSNDTLDLVHEGMDLAIRLGRLQDSRLVATRLAPRQMYLCASPPYIQRYGRPHSLSELNRHNCLIGGSDTGSFSRTGVNSPNVCKATGAVTAAVPCWMPRCTGSAYASCRITTCRNTSTTARWCRCWRHINRPTPPCGRCIRSKGTCHPRCASWWIILRKGWRCGMNIASNRT